MQQTNPTSTQTVQEEGFNFGDFLSFKTMITLRVIQIVYAVVAVIITFYGVSLIFKGEKRGWGDDSLIPGGVFPGMVVLLIGNVFWRIWCELMIVFFRINKSLNAIEKNTNH